MLADSATSLESSGCSASSPRCAQYQTRFRYILVDEYQDTNVAQYLWLRLLGQNISRTGGGNGRWPLRALRPRRGRNLSPLAGRDRRA